MDMATLFTVQSPSDISILGPGGSEMASLDLKYTANEKVENKVTIRRVICVQSAAELHQLEIVHTTNMKDLTFNLYPASAVDDTMVNTTVTDGGFSYKYNPDHKISGKYINVNNMNNGYNYASASYHEKIMKNIKMFSLMRNQYIGWLQINCRWIKTIKLQSMKLKCIGLTMYVK